MPHRLIDALLRKPTDRTPVWIMRQAGRYLPEYQAIRAKAGSFMDLCRNPKLATEVTLQPLRRYPQLDAAILFSDILTIPDAMGLGLSFDEGKGPSFARPIRHTQDIKNLPKLTIKTDLNYVLEAVRCIRHALNNTQPLIGFSGSPWTLATYMVEGESKTDFGRIKTLLYNNPHTLHQLLQILADTVTDYLNAQIEHGAQVVQIFDTWGGILSEQAYHDFSLHYMAQIISNLHKTQQGQAIPCIVFTKGGGQWLNMMADSGADALGLDWTINITAAKKQVGNKVALQGNLDPAALKSQPQNITAEAQRILKQFAYDGNSQGHIFNLGHGITPDIEPDNVQALLAAIEQYQYSA